MCVTYLVAVVGATFAYFTATANDSDTSAGSANVQTAEVAEVQLTASKITGSENTVWPGTKNYIGASVVASVETEGTNTGTTYDVSYKLTGSVSVNEAFIKGKITWKLYKLASEVKADVITCNSVSGGTNNQYSQTCSLNEAFSEQEPVANGEIAIGASEASAVEYTGTITTGAPTEYFYLVYEYENNSALDQSDDAGGTKTITATITSITNTGMKQHTA